jgi:light-regulated signal transduction histidine kinase (bacteriophytochrome)
MSKRIQRSTVVRYSVSVLLVLVTLTLTVVTRPLFGGKAPLIFCTLGVIAAAAFGGAGPGMLNTILSVAIVRFLFPDKIFSLLLAQSSLLSFAILGVTVSVVFEKFRRTNAELHQAKAHLEQANQQLSHRTEALARSNEELQRFAYALSHDLQTPLRTVRLHTEFLVDRNFELLSADDKQSAQFIVTGIERMQSMIKGLLDYSTATEDQGKRTSIDCNAVLRVVLEDLRDGIEEANAIVTFDRLPVVEANCDRVTQVFSNLIGNALKYRTEKRPEIHISARPENQAWVFSVKDNGIGIDMGHAERIFRVFERLHSGDAYEGSGIGLAICRAIIQRHGGRIWVESEAGKGCTFSFTLPSEAGTSPGVRKREAVHSA